MSECVPQEMQDVLEHVTSKYEILEKFWVRSFFMQSSSVRVAFENFDTER